MVLCYFAANWSENDTDRCDSSSGTVGKSGIVEFSPLKPAFYSNLTECCDGVNSVRKTRQCKGRQEEREVCWEVRGQAVLYLHRAFQMEIPPKGRRPWRRTEERGELADNEKQRRQGERKTWWGESGHLFITWKSKRNVLAERENQAEKVKKRAPQQEQKFEQILTDDLSFGTKVVACVNIILAL